MKVLFRGASTAAIACALSSTMALAQQNDAEGNGVQDTSDTVYVYGDRWGLIPVESTTATKSSLPLIDLPATVTVIGRELIDLQSATGLQEILNNTSGLDQAGNNYGVGDYLQMRGLPVSYAFDGMYGGAGLGPDSYAPTRTLTNVERVEVLQGANATVYGAGAAGGIVNMIEKKPQRDEAYLFEARGGSFGTYGATLDATGPLNDVLSYRFVGSYYNQDGYRDLGTERYELYGTLAADFADNNRLTLSLAWLDDEVQVDSIGDPVRIYNAASTTPGGVLAEDATVDNLPNDPGSSLVLTADQQEALVASLAAGDGLEPYDLGDTGLISPLSRPNDGEELRVKLRWEWEPVPGLNITPSTQYRTYASNYVRQTGAYNYVYWNRSGVINQPPRAPLVEADVLYPFAARRQEYRRVDVEESSLDNFLDISYKSDIFGISNEFLLTGYYQDISISANRASLYDADSSRSSDNPVPYIYDITNPNWPTGSFEDYDIYISADYDKNVRTMGVGFQNIAYLTEWLIFRGGFGINEIKQEYETYDTDRSTAQELVDQTDSGHVYNLGLTVKPTEWASAFVSFAKGRTAYSFEGGTFRDDSESKNFEAGLKFQSVDGLFAGGISYFETSRTNLRYNNPEYEDDPLDPLYNISVPQYFYDGKDWTQGVQADFNAFLTDALFINANATYQDARNRQNPTSSSFDTKQKGVPDWAFNATAVYELPIAILGGTTRVNLGYEFLSERTINSSSFGLPDAKLPDQGLWNAGIEFESDGPWSANLRVRNLTNTLAYERALFLGGLPEDPRSVEFVIRSEW